MSFLQNLDRAAGAAVCTWLRDGGNAALGGAVISAAVVPGGQVPALAAGLGVLALNYGCSFDPNTPIDPGADQGFCRESATGSMRFEQRTASGTLRWFTQGHRRIESIATVPDAAQPERSRFLVSVINGQGVAESILSALIDPGSYYVTIPSDGQCAEQGPPSVPYQLPPVNHTDEVCNINVEFLGWKVNGDGSIEPALKMSSAAGRTGDGVVGGCSFDPVIYVGAPGGPGTDTPRVVPFDPTPDVPGETPKWVRQVDYRDCPTLKEIEELIEKRLPSQVPGSTYELRSVCEVDGDGNPAQQVITKDVPDGASIQAVVDRLDALPELLQGLKDFRQPTCPKVPRPVGRSVTVRFRQISSDDGQYIRKVFRYRAQGAADLAAHTEHWKGFQWETGPVCVISKGLDWGVPQVWAASEAEGKRVIQHAADVAGVNLLDGRHEWIVTSSRNSRYGRSALVGVEKRRDLYGVAMRDGPDGLPVRIRVEGSYPTP